jgi:hypothetical protein
VALRTGAEKVLDFELTGMRVDRQPLWSRVGWFGVGAVLNYGLIATVFGWLSASHWSVWAASACSVAAATSCLFAWNVLLNFRGDNPLTIVLPRYVAAVILIWLCSSAVLTFLKHIDLHIAFGLGGTQLDFDVLGMQCFLAAMKFTLYHKWVFPASAAPSRRRR